MSTKKLLNNKPLFIRSFSLAKSNINKVLLMILFDVLFVVSVYALYKLASFFTKTLVVNSSIIPSTLSLSIFILYSLVYYLIVILIYSFMKYCLLNFIKSIFQTIDLSFKRLGEFYLLNIIIVGIFFVIMLVFNLVLAGIKYYYRPYVFILIAIPYALFLYVIINTAHPLFYEENSIKNSINKSFKITFTKVKSYRGIILVIIFFALLLWLLFSGSGYLIRLLFYKNYNLYLNAYVYFVKASKLIATLVLYFIVLINRISFYQLVKNFNASH
ncbi:hypothetical protein HYW99_02455 [Candidatus Woesearchaeota archaeon]|nr:hypothetical protein [Candidatus Woesearchaeota archaeon]